MLGDIQLESRFAEKDPVVLVNTKLNMSQQCTFATKKPDDILGHLHNLPKTLRQSDTNRWKEVIVSLYSALARPYPEYWFQFWASKRGIELLQRVQ